MLPIVARRTTYVWFTTDGGYTGLEEICAKRYEVDFGMCGILSIMVIAVFCCALILDRRRRQLHYDNRADIISHLMQQLEIPLSSMSVAVEALQNDKVIYNSEKRQFYQEIINAENARLNERVNKIFEL